MWVLNFFLYPSLFFFFSLYLLLLYNMHIKTSSRPSFIGTSLAVLVFWSQQVGCGTLSAEEGVMVQPFSLSLTIQLVDWATELINMYLMLCTLHSGLSAVWASGESQCLGKFPLCSHGTLSAILVKKRY